MRKFILLLATPVLILLNGCKDQDPNYGIPDIPVQLWIDLQSPQYSALQPLSGSVYLEGGSQGIVVFHSIQDEYLAFDRHSTYEPQNNCVVEIDSSFVAVEDPCSNSKWTLYYGSPISGPATLPLKQYQTYFDGRNLRIYN